MWESAGAMCGYVLRRVSVVLALLTASCTAGTSGRAIPEEGAEQALPERVTPILSPAPTRHCPVIVRASSLPPGVVASALKPFLPGYVPPGFGVLVAWNANPKSGENGPGVIWSNERCQTVTLSLYPSVGPTEEPEVGDWVLDVYHRDCYTPPSPKSRCALDYRTEVPEGQLALGTGGLPRPLADAIALSVPL